MQTIALTVPPDGVFTGERGSELVVLSVSIVRIAQRVQTGEVIETADGPVKARVGDFIIATAESERYPITPAIFLGTYQILGTVGRRFIGRRLLHPRRAWEVLTDHAECDYGADRGRVAAPKGGWFYHSDDNDYGYINPEAKRKAHVVVGTVSELNEIDWSSRLRLGAAILTWLLRILPKSITNLL